MTNKQADELLISLDNVRVTSKGKPYYFDQKFYKGQLYWLQGCNGSGKTLLLKLIAGIARPDSGKVYICGESLQDMTYEGICDVRRYMGLMFPEVALFEDRTVFDNVIMPTIASGDDYSTARKNALEALKKCGIDDLADRMPSELTTGQKQIVCIARALANKPRVILADEPFSHLDVEYVDKVMSLFGAITVHDRTSIIFASHIDPGEHTVYPRPVYLDDNNHPDE